MKEALRLLGFVGLILLFPALATTMAPSRFEVHSNEYHPVENGSDIIVNAVHDTGSGMELICVTTRVYGGSAISCVPTGRNWR